MEGLHKPLDFGEWLEGQYGSHNKHSLLNIRNEIAGEIWLRRGAPPVSSREDYDMDRNNASQLLFKAYVEQNPQAREEIVNMWRKNGHK